MALRKANRDEKLARDDREFDAQIVRSALDFYNSFHAHPTIATGQPYSEIVERVFAWVPPVMELRAKGAGVDPANVRWRNTETGRDISAASTVLLFNVGAFKGGDSIEFANGRRITTEQWLNEVFAALPIYSRFNIEKGEIRLASVPCLTGVQQCIAYALALIKLNRHGFGELVRRCEFLTDERPGSLAHHYFLADDPRRQFCSPAHGNAHRQREWRRAHAAPRKPK